MARGLLTPDCQRHDVSVRAAFVLYIEDVVARVAWVSVLHDESSSVAVVLARGLWGRETLGALRLWIFSFDLRL